MLRVKISILLLIIIPFVSSEDRKYGQNRWMNYQTQQAIEKGLAYLIRNQKTGRFGDLEGAFLDSVKEAQYSIAITSFACLALMADGNLPGRGRYGNHVAKGLEFILRCVNQNGYISRQGDDSRMHGHGFATLFLAEVYGTATSSELTDRIRDKLDRAIILIRNSQTPDGGWGYLPTDTQHEGSITVVQIQALRASRNVGIHVPKKVIDRAVEYIRRSANPDGSFKYRLGMSASRKSFPLAAAGVASLNATGEYESREIQKGLEFMMQYLPPQGKEDRYYHAFYYYGQFYAAQAMYHAPLRYWEKWFPATRDDILTKQDSVTGAWGKRSNGASRFGSVYATAIAVLILQIPYNYLPIFQR